MSIGKNVKWYINKRRIQLMMAKYNNTYKLKIKIWS